MWLMANKKIENWIFWIVGNIISVPLYWVKGLGFSSVQFSVFYLGCLRIYRMEKELLQNKDNLIRAVLFGPESTGKTTMSKALAKHYETEWVTEYAQELLQKKWNETKEICSEEDILPIAYGQMKIENEGAKKANQILISTPIYLKHSSMQRHILMAITIPTLQLRRQQPNTTFISLLISMYPLKQMT